MPSAHTVKIRVNPQDKTAVYDGVTRLSFGDILTVAISGALGADLSSLGLYIFSKDTSSALVAPVTAFERSTSSGSFQSTANLTVATATLTSEISELAPGEPLVARLYVADSNRVFADCDIDILPSPHTSASSWPEAQAPFVTEDQVILKSDLAEGLAPILVMPTANAAQREARMEALLSLLSDLTS